ncbi:MutS-related protein [Flammeovirga kamogawensis]|uniref:DNA mismatch repair proteins mutS family domain-containing protein n=1 Tax=Flammeovirga kamogawensis TaxID=373891 RepID=A0ABX8H5Q7_9BACT|nr:DNA mismatch repair protein MutS [Flammeovirga kamogawensis]MBB6461831.1 hypothetical protein [Flammeovirga kamogawensis]QWG10746.1 hypothetical protein KM029_25520 [Flammeovirga kamogawensis]TRX63848.1 DNA mismatch repair protein MutS [Flammeovirga kamogawensis]
MDNNTFFIIGGIISFILFRYYGIYKSKEEKIAFFKTQWGKKQEDRYINFDRVKIYLNKSTNSSIYQKIEQNSINDLDLNDVFRFINRTCSSIGEQYMYFKFLTINTLTQKNTTFNKLTSFFQENTEKRLEIQLLLSKLSSSHGFNVEKLIHDKFGKNPDYNWLSYFSNILTITCLILSIKFPFLLAFILILFLMNMAMHMLNKRNLDTYSDIISYLFLMLKVKKKMHPHLKNSIDDIDTRGIERIKWYSFFIKFSSEEDGDPIKQILFWGLEIIKIAFNIEVIAFFLCIRKLEKQAENINQLYQYIGTIDTAQSIANVLDSDIATCIPTFSDTYAVKNSIHPLIKNCVPNSFSLSKRGMLLTGSNMSGKTTFIRTIGLNTILAQNFNFCFADEYTAPFFKIYSSIRINDSIKDNSSYYLQEVKTVKKIVDASEVDLPSLFIMDELFKGTNTIERIKGANAILSYIGRPPHYTFIATHDLELTDLQKNNYELWHFSEKIDNNDLVFDHKLKRGKISKLNAIKILDHYHYPKQIINACNNLEVII